MPREVLPSTQPERRAGAAKVAVLWDESFLWGVMAHKALVDAGLPFELIRSDSILRGDLDRYGMLFVPGGWASHKMAALGEAGAEAVRRFVADGGWYLGICGGAGLATREGIGLLDVKRRSGRDRVPSFSGRVRLATAEDPLWQGLDAPVFHAWWPSQFAVDTQKVKVLASYSEALPDAFSSDLNVGDVTRDIGWVELEALYGMKLDPSHLCGEPAVVGGEFGKGRVILSLVHLDTVGDPNGSAVLTNLWGAVPDGKQPGGGREAPRADTHLKQGDEERALAAVLLLERAVEDLIALGIRNFLWYWRTPLLLMWRRGVRGLEYCTLHVLVREIAERVRAQHALSPGLVDAVAELPISLAPFLEQAKRLLVLERHAMARGQITYNRCEDEDIREIRMRLFSNGKSHGGSFKTVIDAIDSVLFELLTADRRYVLGAP
jgi:hypothetical protein